MSMNEECCKISGQFIEPMNIENKPPLIFYIVAETICIFIPPRDEIVNCVKPNCSLILSPLLALLHLNGMCSLGV